MDVACESLGVSKRCARTVASFRAKKWRVSCLFQNQIQLFGAFTLHKYIEIMPHSFVFSEFLFPSFAGVKSSIRSEKDRLSLDERV